VRGEADRRGNDEAERVKGEFVMKLCFALCVVLHLLSNCVLEQGIFKVAQCARIRHSMRHPSRAAKDRERRQELRATAVLRRGEGASNSSALEMYQARFGNMHTH
jgi:hypothetical protein